MILRDGAACVRAATVRIALHQRRDVVRNAPKLQRYPSAVDRQDGILGPRVGPQRPVRLVVAVGQPDASRVEVELRPGSDPSQKRYMRVPAAIEIGRVAA